MRHLPCACVCVFVASLGLKSYMLWVLLLEDGSWPPKHTEGKTAYFMYTVYVKTVNFNPWVQKTARLGPVLVLSGTDNSPEQWNLKTELFWYIQPIAVFLNVFMSIKFSNIISCSLSLHNCTVRRLQKWLIQFNWYCTYCLILNLKGIIIAVLINTV